MNHERQSVRYAAAGAASAATHAEASGATTTTLRYPTRLRGLSNAPTPPAKRRTPTAAMVTSRTSATRKRKIWSGSAPVCVLWLTDETNPASAYAHQCRTGVSRSAHKTIEFVGHSGETNRGGKLLA